MNQRIKLSNDPFSPNGDKDLTLQVIEIGIRQVMKIKNKLRASTEAMLHELIFLATCNATCDSVILAMF